MLDHAAAIEEAEPGRAVPAPEDIDPTVSGAEALLGRCSGACRIPPPDNDWLLADDELAEPAEPVVSANATAGSEASQPPTPNATANAPTRPTGNECPPNEAMMSFRNNASTIKRPPRASTEAPARGQYNVVFGSIAHAEKIEDRIGTVAYQTPVTTSLLRLRGRRRGSFSKFSASVVASKN